MLKLRTYKPELFSDLIDIIWMAENDEKPVEVIIPPNQYVNLIFPVNNSKYTYEKAIVDKPKIYGISLGSSSFTYTQNIKLIGIRFHAYGIFPFIRIKGNHIINRSINCPLDFGLSKENTETLMDEPDHALLKGIYAFLEKHFDIKAYESIKPLIEFYSYYRWNEETSSLEGYCKKNGTNYSTLNRKFSGIVGISPKKFERLIKFRKSLCSLIDSDENLSAISSNSGYFDQAHFIREFKLFLNQTPSAYQALIKRADKDSKIINYNFRLLNSD